MRPLFPVSSAIFLPTIDSSQIHKCTKFDNTVTTHVHSYVSREIAYLTGFHETIAMDVATGGIHYSQAPGLNSEFVWVRNIYDEMFHDFVMSFCT